MNRLSKTIVALVALDAAICLPFGILHPLIGDWDSDRDRVIFALLVAGGGILLVAGLVTFRRSPTLSAVLVSVGAVAAALGLFWTLLVPLLAIVLIVLSVIRVRRQAPSDNGGAIDAA